MNQKTYLVRVDERKEWTPINYREVTKEELDDLLEVYGGKVLSICSNGKQGSMSMWACFKNHISKGCYSDLINAYRILSDDNKSLVDREHELRHAWNQYIELWRIRHFGSVENYYLEKANEAKEYFERYNK